MALKSPELLSGHAFPPHTSGLPKVEQLGELWRPLSQALTLAYQRGGVSPPPLGDPLPLLASILVSAL